MCPAPDGIQASSNMSKREKANQTAGRAAAPPGLLFTAFEPSGDDHAAVVIEELRRRYTSEQLPIYAWGGAKMAAAGAEVFERTGDDAVMGVPGFRKVLEHRAINARIRKWLAGPGKGRVSVHVPVDSPGANFPICKITKKAGLRVVHLVAPQIWAWASWRIRKLRRLTNLVLCLLPFEEHWFLDRGVPAKFVGHPLFERPLSVGELDRRVGAIEDGLTDARMKGRPRLALMPGSRPAEMTSCFPVLLDAYRRLRADFPGTCALVAATRPEVAERLREIAVEAGFTPDESGWPEGVGVVSGDADAVIRWCDYALVVSGTVTLQIARQRKPMVAVYRPHWLMYQLLGRWLVSTEVFTLPNLIAGAAGGGRGGGGADGGRAGSGGGSTGRAGRVIPEFIPHFGDGEPLAVEVIKLMRRTDYADDQREGLEQVCRRFENGPRTGPAAADALEIVLGLKNAAPSAASVAVDVAQGSVGGRSEPVLAQAEQPDRQ